MSDADGLRPADYPEVFAHFRAEEPPAASIYPYSPVFPCRIGGQQAVLKRARSRLAGAEAVAEVTRQWAAAGVPVVVPLAAGVANPVLLGERTWVAYPFVAGEPYTGTADQLAAAGDLLGRIHAAPGPARLPAFPWPDHGPDSVAEDVAALRTVVARYVPEPAVTRLVELVTRFPGEVLPPIRAAAEAGQLPVVNAVMDYKANNLVYTPDGPVLVDPDNGDCAPRLLDLALAVLLFHTEHDPAPARLFDAGEWSTFLAAYQRHVDLTDRERELWRTALAYQLNEEGAGWALTNDEADWRQPRQRTFLQALATVDPTAPGFPLAGVT